MNKKGDSVAFVVITAVAFVLIGLALVTFGGKPNVTSKATYEQYLCFTVENNALTPVNADQCCSVIRKSTGCKPTTIKGINEQLYSCDSVVANKALIEFCSP